jgi:hypothetical protein
MKKNFVSLITLFYIIIFINSKPVKVKKSFKDSEKAFLISGTVNSFKTQIPYDLYYLDICAPEDISLIYKNWVLSLIQKVSDQLKPQAQPEEQNKENSQEAQNG